jgi:hypothetical protein
MPDAESVTPEVVAEWMLSQLERKRWFYQDAAVHAIGRRFGEEFIYLNESGNPAIDRRVLRAFRKLTADTVIWDRSEFAWRKRAADDAPGRSQE